MTKPSTTGANGSFVIVAGQIPAGQHLPSELSLEQSYGVSRTTIRRAIAILRHEGLVTVQRGHRVRVRDRSELQGLTVPVGAVSVFPADRWQLRYRP